MNIEDVRDRLITNRQIADTAARATNMDTLIADITVEWGVDKVDKAFEEAVLLISPP